MLQFWEVGQSGGGHRPAPGGFSFQELYDFEEVRLKSQYFDLYAKVKHELEQKGVKFD